LMYVQVFCRLEEPAVQWLLLYTIVISPQKGPAGICMYAWASMGDTCAPTSTSLILYDCGP
jgi:hypothetical protein